MQMSIFRLSNRITSRAGFMSTPGGGIDYVSFQMFFHRSLIILLKVMLLHSVVRKKKKSMGQWPHVDTNQWAISN